MRQAAQAVIGIEVRVGVNTWVHPDRFMDERGREMWETVLGLMVPGVAGVSDLTRRPI